MFEADGREFEFESKQKSLTIMLIAFRITWSIFVVIHHRTVSSIQYLLSYSFMHCVPQQTYSRSRCAYVYSSFGGGKKREVVKWSGLRTSGLCWTQIKSIPLFQPQPATKHSTATAASSMHQYLEASRQWGSSQRYSSSGYICRLTSWIATTCPSAETNCAWRIQFQPF